MRRGDIDASPKTRDLVLVGGGHAHALALRRWGMKPLPGARLTLISPRALTPYSGMLPGHVAGHYARRESHIDLAPLARFAGARLIFAEAETLDPRAKTVSLRGRPPVPYDVLSINVGVTTPQPADAEAFAHVTPVKPVETFLAAWDAFLEKDVDQPRLAVIGGGVGGVELALAMAHRLRLRRPTVTLLERADALLTDLPASARTEILRALDAAGVEIRLGADVVVVRDGGLEVADGTVSPIDFAVSAAGAQAPTWLESAGLPLDERGFLKVDSRLRSIGDPHVFAAGDVAAMVGRPRPKAGVYAVRQAPALEANLRAALSGGDPRPFDPQKRYLKLISLGAKRATGARGPFSISGDWVWRWKDRIDRRFMARFENLDVVAETMARGEARRAGRTPAAAQGLAEMLAGDPLCGACGAKIGQSALSGAFADLGATARAAFPDGEIDGLGDDAALLPGPEGARLAVSVDQLRAVTLDPHVHAQTAVLHAFGDIWAMGATPDAALLTITLPPLSPELQRVTLAEALDGAATALRRLGARVIGGHTAQGAEIAIGVVAIGRLTGAPIGLAGARPGDVLVLTKPLGSGVALAAEMRGRAPGETVEALLAQLLEDPAPAAQALRAAQPSALTDVTGFGLAGHLSRMLAAARCDATLELDAIPFLSGAPALAARGVRSSLYPENAAAAPVTLAEARQGDPRAALLHDPQTAGGLLAALAPEAAERLLAAAGGGGPAMWRIGRLTAAAEPQSRITVF